MNSTHEKSRMTKAEALESLAQTKERYEEARERLVQIAGRVDRYRKVVTESEAAEKHFDQKWREQLRADDGRISKETKALQRQKVEAGELALEMKEMISEAEPFLDQRRRLTAIHRNSYLQACNRAAEIAADEDLETLARQVSDGQPAADLFGALARKMDVIALEARNYLETVNGKGWVRVRAEGQQELEREIEHRQGRFLIDFARSMGQATGAEVQGIDVLERLPQEQDPNEGNNPYPNTLETYRI